MMHSKKTLAIPFGMNRIKYPHRMDSYEDIYHYQPPKVPVKEDEREL